MNLPAEILNNAPLILEHAKDFVLSHVESGFQDYLWKRLVRGLATRVPSLKEMDPRDLQTRLERVEATMDGFADEMERLGAHASLVAVTAEMNEPAAQEFVTEALEAAMESPSEGKRALLGRLIVHRLASTTESSDELYLRQAFQIVQRTNERQLHLLATMHLIRNPPVPKQAMNRQELNRWFDEHLLPVLIGVGALDPDFRDLEYLTSIGAATFSESERDKAYGGMGGNATGLEMAIVSKTNEYPMPGLNTSGNFYRRAADLIGGKHDKQHGIGRLALAPYALTTSGSLVAVTIVEGLLRQTSLPAAATSEQ